MGKGDRNKHFSSAKAAEALQAARGGAGIGGFSGSTPTAPGGAGGFAFGAKYVGQVAAAVPRPGSGAAGGSADSAASAGVRAAGIIPSDLDGELSQQLQKLSKRDATTKLKALQALKVLVKDKPVADLQAALPSWAYLYGRLVLDNNRAVRAEASHVSAALATAVGRGIAPLLKALLPAWWLAQCDGYAEAAGAARGAFAAAFPVPAKQRDAVLFCRGEVLQLLADNLASTPQTLGDPKKESAEELQDRHERVLAASCTALAALLDLAEGSGSSSRTSGDAASISGGTDMQPGATAGEAAQAARSPAEQALLDGIGAQLQQPSFYKAVLQSKAAPVRRQAYLLVAAAAARQPELLAPAVPAAAPAVLGALSDKEPSTHEALCGMLLAYARAFPGSWAHINMQKAFLPRLWAFLRHGCYFSAATSFPAVLPLVSLLPEAVLGPHPGFFASLLESIWQGLASLGGVGPSAQQARQAAAAAFQDCLLYGLLRADRFAAVGGLESGGAGAEHGAAAAGASGTAPGQPATGAGQLYCSDLLREGLGKALMPAALGTAAAAQPDASEAEAILTGVASKLGQPSASSSSRQRLEQLMQAVGSQLATAVQAALEGSQQQAADASSASTKGDSARVCDRAAALVAALDKAAGPAANAALGSAVAHPLVALLLPEVRSGTAPPAASSLLAALLKAFPQHAAAGAAVADLAEPVAGEASTAAATAAAPAAAPADVPAGEFASLRLHQSASFTIESILRRLTQEQQPEAVAASCDLLLSCLPQVHQPARKLAEVLQRLVQQGQAASAVLLLEHLVSGQHDELAGQAVTSAELDNAAVTALGPAGTWLAAADLFTLQLLQLLVAGTQGRSLLSPSGQAAVLGRLLEQLHVAATLAAEASTRGSGGAEATPLAAPVLQVLQDALLLPCLNAASGSGAGGEVQSLLLQLLAAAFSVLVRESAAEAEEAAAAAAAAGADSTDEHDASDFVDESDVESVEVELQPGAACAAARQLWQRQAAITHVLASAPPEQQAGFLAAVQDAVRAVLETQPSPAAATAAAEAAAVLVLALGSDSSLRNRLFQGLLRSNEQPAATSGSSSSSAGGSRRYSMPQAIFLAGLGAAVGFDALLSHASPGEASAAAVELLVALEAGPAAAASEQQQHQLLHHVAGSTHALLPPALETAAAGAAGPSPGRHAEVLRALLQAAVRTDAASTAAAASFFAAAVASAAAGSTPGQQQLPLGLLQDLLLVVAPAFRSSSALLEQSGLAALSQRLCQQCTAAEPAAVAAAGGQLASLEVLEAAIACFPCTTGAEAAAQLPSPAAAAAAAAGGGGEQGAGAASFAKGDAVWYCRQDGSWSEAEVAAVDRTVEPPSFGIQLSGSGTLRETEAHRLRPRQPGAPPPASAAAQQAAAAAAAAAAAEKRAAAGAAMPPVGCCTAEEQAALLALLQHQVRGLRAAAAAARAAGGPAEPPPAVTAAIAQLLHSSLAYCSQQVSRQQWATLLEQLRDAFAQCSAVLAAAAGRVAAAVCASAAVIAVGADMQSPAVALQFFRRLRIKGVLERSQKARGEAAKVAASLATELASLDRDLLPLLLPLLQAYTRAAAAAGSSRSLAERDWQAAEAAVCGDMLQLFVTAGCITAAAAVSGQEAAGTLSSWMAGQHAQQAAAAWQLLSQHVDTTLRAADRPFLLAAVDRANAGMDATGVDALGSLLALSLSGIPPPAMSAPAFAAILQHPELTAALTSAESVDEEQLEEQQQQQQQQQQAGSGSGTSGSDAAVLLEQAGVRPELAAAVATGSGSGASSGGAGASGFFCGWALLLAHVLAAPADSHGRRLLAQVLKDAHSLVPALLDAVVPLLPLEGATGRRGDQASSTGGTGGSASGSSGTAPGSGSAAASSGSSSSFAQQLALLGPFPASADSHSDDAPDSPLAAQQEQRQLQGGKQRQRFAVLLYAATLQALPASARLWFADVRDRSTAAATERYTSAAVSGQLLSAELAAVTEAASAFGKFDKFSVRANATSREVIAVMEVEDGHMLELAVRLPASMPLRPPELECRRKVGVSEGRLRKWLLSISAFLRMQNGSVAEAISLWKRNVDKEFEGQEECLICYSIIQPTSGQLPRLSCRTCKKRFHGGCLYKWFKSSGKSNCPHCQSPW